MPSRYGYQPRVGEAEQATSFLRAAADLGLTASELVACATRALAILLVAAVRDCIGPSRTVKVGNRVIRLKHASSKLMAMKDRPAGDVVRAIHWLGPDIAKDDQIIDTLRQRLPPQVKRDLAKAKPSMTAWAARVADRVLA